MLLPGMRWARPASVTVYSAKPPGAEAMTRSPGLKSLTSLPTASTSPEHSRPMRAPTPPTGPCWMPAATNVSARLRLEARTLIRISLGFGSGFGRSRISTPFSPRTAAFTIIPPVGLDVLSFGQDYYKARPIMNQLVRPKIGASACPHDCPSTCALEVEILDGRTIGRVRGAEENAYTAGVICAKVARYAERAHHPDRLKHPLRRVGAKGSGQFAPISWDNALDLVAEQFLRAEQKHGSEAVWPYYYAGTMGFVQRDGINRLRHAKKYSGFFSTICVNPAWTGFIAGTGKLAGADPREMAKSDLVTIWGTNAVNTQVNVMTHATRARKDRGAKIVVVDIYMNSTMQQADLAVLIRPGTDGALACAVMHCLFRDDKADWDYLERYTDAPHEFAAHLRTRDPEWASGITGAPVETIEAFAKLVGDNKRAFFRLGYGFSRSRNGAINMHAASCIAAVIGAWRLEGGGAFHNNGDVFHLNKSLIEGGDVRDPAIRMLDQSRIGPILTGDTEALQGGGPVTALLIQNTNPVSVAPDQDVVKRGFARDDLFVCV